VTAKTQKNQVKLIEVLSGTYIRWHLCIEIGKKVEKLFTHSIGHTAIRDIKRVDRGGAYVVLIRKHTNKFKNVDSSSSSSSNALK
jgi:hypothetical protein